MDIDLSQRRLTEIARFRSLDQAYKLKLLLEKLKANIVTVESLTAGMILKTLVDVPMQGATVYGGLGVYDTDAKRLWLGVKTRGVYGHKTAIQMAEGALNNSRASVALAVTGDAMPFPDHKDRLGKVYIGVSIRKKNDKKKTFTKKLESCDDITSMCNAWKELTDKNLGRFAPIQMTALIADYIRMITTAEALKFCHETLSNFQSNVWQESIDSEPWDEDCQPSWIISHMLKNKSKSKQCDDENMDTLPSMSKKKSMKTLYI